MMRAKGWGGMCAAILAIGMAVGCAAAEESEVDVWAPLLRPQYFGDRDIVEGKDLV